MTLIKKSFKIEKERERERNKIEENEAKFK